MHLHFPISMSTCPVTGNIVSAKSQSDYSFLSGQIFTTLLHKARDVKFIDSMLKKIVITFIQTIKPTVVRWSECDRVVSSLLRSVRTSDMCSQVPGPGDELSGGCGLTPGLVSSQPQPRNLNTASQKFLYLSHCANRAHRRHTPHT